MYILNLFLSLVLFGCNYTISTPILQTTEMEEMISIDCNAEFIKSYFETVTKDYYLLKKRKFVTNISRVKNLFKTKKAGSTCASLKNPVTLIYEVTDTGLKTCENNCCEKNKSNAENYNKKIPIVIEKLLKQPDFKVQVEAICENVGECIWKKQKKIFECKCKENYRILVTKLLNSNLIGFYENEVRKNVEYFNSHHTFAGFMFLLKCQPETASKYLEWSVKQLKNFPMKNRENTSVDRHNSRQRNKKTSTSLCLRGRRNDEKEQTTNNNYCCPIKNDNRRLPSSSNRCSRCRPYSSQSTGCHCPSTISDSDSDEKIEECGELECCECVGYGLVAAIGIALICCWVCR